MKPQIVICKSESELLYVLVHTSVKVRRKTHFDLILNVHWSVHSDGMIIATITLGDVVVLYDLDIIQINGNKL